MATATTSSATPTPIAIPSASGSSPTASSTTRHSVSSSSSDSGPTLSNGFASSILAATSASSSNQNHHHSSSTDSSTSFGSGDSPPRNHFREKELLQASGLSPEDRYVWDCKGESGGLQLRSEKSWNEAETPVLGNTGCNTAANKQPTQVLCVSPNGVHFAESAPSASKGFTQLRKRAGSMGTLPFGLPEE
ncbi:hypothetical protein T439DRAFT_322934 [Meredithblackwellia eburnea MCA 4105]